MEGWIKLHRKMVEWEWYDDANTFRLFMHCLIKANHKDKTWRGNDIKRGEFITSYDKLAKELKLSVKQIRVSLGKLKKTNEVASKSTTQHTVIQVLRYDEYQEEGKQSDEQKANKRQTRGKRGATTKNDKNDKNEKKQSVELCLDGISSDKLELVKTYIDYRKEIGAKLTQRALDLLTDKINNHSYAQVEHVINKSIENSWKGLFFEKIPNLEVQPKTRSKSFQEYMDYNKKTNPQACQD
jgi:hypothetical protein